ncbi:WhiB family transcriptional regulator [Pseudarthrobacter sp. J75]|uniref:WhiB family transcriptional regulator n=1 Tax=unclassified Pseudarthrobacter TaxID=2647000 RepID=UPI002E811FCA|nr:MULTISPECIES: WhiB family transcriptional regulator [unclassified Pseudarthrobacter]MEE2521633.1 WhiB family transcriptional regulator [Pseudarthrobacter sp. J47]MEE2527710.1 WhiB family transcriptional regulator [Pseudarthrobacter sp. J75]MEE2570897.1 WhiB family transcriptional regulator [Pseudarthrobacter sp. J64]
MGQAERIHDEAVVAGQATAKYHSRGIPSDWYVDPADPDAAERYNSNTRDSIEDQATAFLAAHEALLDGTGEVDPLDPPMELLATPRPIAQPVWIGLPSGQEFDDEGELGWQTDALCAQTDPEAFFPEKGGSTRDAKKVCGSCNVRSQCLEYALANDERFGIWGGLSERERRRLRKRAV